MLRIDGWWTMVLVQQLHVFRQTPGCSLVAYNLSQLLCVESAHRDVDLAVGKATRSPVCHAITLGPSLLPASQRVVVSACQQ